MRASSKPSQAFSIGYQALNKHSFALNSNRSQLIPSFGSIFTNASTMLKDRNATHVVWTEVMCVEARLAPAVTGALCSAFDSLRDEVDPARLK